MILVPGDLFYALIAVQFIDGLTKLVHDVLLMKLEPGWSVSRMVGPGVRVRPDRDARIDSFEKS